MTDSEQVCQRCNDNTAFAEFSHRAIDGEQTSRYVICEDCLRSLGEWFRNPEEDSA